MTHNSRLPSRSPGPSKPPPLPSEPKLVLPPKLAPGPEANHNLFRVLAWVMASAIAVLLLMSAVVLLVLPLRSEVAKDLPLGPLPSSIHSASSEAVGKPSDEEPSLEAPSIPETKSLDEEAPAKSVAPDPTEGGESPSIESPPPSPSSTDPFPKRPVSHASFWTIAPSFPHEPAMKEGKPVGDSSIELTTLPKGSDVTQLELVGAPKVKSDGNQPAFRVVSSGKDARSWSLNLRSLASEREIATVQLEGTRLMLQWKVANPKQISAALAQLSACAFLVSHGDDSKQLVPMSYQKTDALTYGEPADVKASEVFLPEAVVSELQFIGFEFHNSRGDWTLEPPPTTNGQTRKCLVKHAVSEAIESQFAIQRKSGDGVLPYFLSWELAIGGQKIRKDQASLISNLHNLVTKRDEYSRQLSQLESQAEDLQSEGTRAAFRENHLKRAQIKKSLAELNSMTKTLGLSDGQIDEMTGRLANGESWPGSVSCYLARKVMHNDKEVLIPLVQIGDLYSP